MLCAINAGIFQLLNAWLYSLGILFYQILYDTTQERNKTFASQHHRYLLAAEEC